MQQVARNAAFGQLLRKSGFLHKQSVLFVVSQDSNRREKHDLSKYVGILPPYYHPRPAREVPPMPKDYKEYPERDLVNFPHYEHRLHGPKTRLLIIPEKWFQHIEKKSGVLGPYMFFLGGLAFCINKEIICQAPEFMTGFGYIVGWFWMYRLVGPSIDKMAAEMADEIFAHDYKDKDAAEKAAKDGIVAEHFLQSCKKSMLEHLFDAKLENVGLQLEDEYRKRLVAAHTKVKRQLDYLIAIEESKRRLQHKHMVNWVVEQVRKSITPELERATMQQCIADLKTLATRA